MLAHVNDVLHPSGFEAIVENDFAGLKQMLGDGQVGLLEGSRIAGPAE
jgi:hypothetical protein